MGIRAKALLIVGLTIVALAAAITWLSESVLMGRVSALEDQLTHEAEQRFLNALANDRNVLDSTVSDWAAWDDTYAFIHDGNQGYVTRNLVAGTFASLGLNFCVFVRTDGSVAWGTAFDLVNKRLAPLPQSLYPHLRVGQPLVTHTNEESVVRGLISLKEGPVLISARPIVRSDESGPIRGTLIMGRYLDRSAIDHLGRLTGLMATVVILTPVSATTNAAPSATEKTRAGTGMEGSDALDIYTLLRDIYEDPCVWIRIRQPARVHEAASLAVSYFTIMLLVFGLVVGATQFLFLNRYVISRLAKLNSDVREMNASGRISSRLLAGANDELSSLATEINRLLDMLERADIAQRALNETLEQRVTERTRALNASQAELRRLYRHAESVREGERRRVAERVHDDMGQSLTALKMGVEWLQTVTPMPSHAMEDRLAEMASTVDEMTDCARDIATDLRPSVLDHLGLQAALVWATQRFADRSGVRCDVDLADFRVEDGAVATAFFRIFQELLTNVTRHANAKNVRVRLRANEGKATLEFDDDGCGVRIQEADSVHSFGLNEIRERAMGLGGEFHIHGQPNRGTHVVVVIPLVVGDAEPERGG